MRTSSIEDGRLAIGVRLLLLRLAVEHRPGRHDVDERDGGCVDRQLDLHACSFRPCST
jgi:hypothetical protein